MILHIICTSTKIPTWDCGFGDRYDKHFTIDVYKIRDRLWWSSKLSLSTFGGGGGTRTHKSLLTTYQFSRLALIPARTPPLKYITVL